jgi:hypothetical protein
MFRSCSYARILRAACRQSLVALAACLLLSGVVAAQDISPAISKQDSSLPASSTPSEHSVYMLATSVVNATGDPGNSVADQPGASDPAAVAAAPGVPASAQVGKSASADSNWHFAISPYLWVPWIYGSLGANGNSFRFYATPDELFSHFRFGLLGLVDTQYKRVVMPLDILWMRLGDDRALPLTPNGTVANAKLDVVIFTFKVGYRVIDRKTIKVDALTGFRYWHFGQNLSFTTNTLNFSRSQDWVTPLVGGRILGNLSPKIEVAIGGDVGGWGTGAKVDYQVGGVLGYRIKPAVALQAGYRYLSWHYTNANKFSNVNISGPLFGATINLK